MCKKIDKLIPRALKDIDDVKLVVGDDGKKVSYGDAREKYNKLVNQKALWDDIKKINGEYIDTFNELVKKSPKTAAKDLEKIEEVSRREA